MNSPEIEGQLNGKERAFLVQAVREQIPPPEVAIEVGTWLGGGSTLHILRTLEANGTGHLWGVEYDASIYDRMMENLRAGAPEVLGRFTALLGRSDEVIPKWLRELAPEKTVDFAFLDGGDQPDEQVIEFQLLDERMPVGAQLMSHDARVRKGKWFVPYISQLDHWRVEVLQLSDLGLLHAKKIAKAPSPASRAAAEKTLKRLRWDPRELLARFLPRSLKKLVIALLPARLFRALLYGKSR